jgi:hypothetical protein
MAFADNYAGLAGAIIACGMNPPVSALPAWLAGKPLNEWFDIPGTSGAGGCSLEEFSGWAFAGTKLVAPACGGHHVPDNRVNAIELNVDAPAWPTTPLVAASPSGTWQPDQPYCTDGHPSSRHIRHTAKWMPELNRVMLIGAPALYTIVSPGSKANVDGFNLDTNTWDAAGTYPSIIGGDPYCDGGACLDPNGNAWAYGCTRKFDKTTRTWTTPLTATAPNRVRLPWARADALNMMFGLQRGDGWAGAGASAIRHVGNVQTQITFNASAVYAQFLVDPAYEAGMDYDPVNNVFLFYSGNVGGLIYRITPNASTVWDMDLFPYGPGNVNPVASTGYTQSRFTYVPAFKGFVLLPKNSSNLKFLRTSL